MRYDAAFLIGGDDQGWQASRTPLFLQPGTDKPHPGPISDEIAALSPNIEVQKDWKGPTFLQESIKRVHAFLAKHTPK